MKDENMNESLWQIIEKEHIESMTNTVIDSKEWNAFVSYFENAFGEEVSLIALEFWNERESNGFESEEPQ